jgi:Outer membrane protein beta-barrel domain
MKKIILLAAAAFFAANATAQDRKVVFGFAVTPVVSFLSAPNDNTVKASGSAFGVGLGIFGDYYFSENYAITGGINFCTNQGGTFEYTKGGTVLAKTLTTDITVNGTTTTEPTNFPEGTKVTYRNQYLEIPIGVKLRTEETDGLRFYGNLPIITFGFRTQSQGDLFVNQTIGGTTFTADLKNENIGQDMAIMNISVGGGLGAEYRLAERTTVYGGLYYAHGLLDQTNNFKRFDGKAEDSNAQLSAISLRVGVNF